MNLYGRLVAHRADGERGGGRAHGISARFSKVAPSSSKVAPCRMSGSCRRGMRWPGGGRGEQRQCMGNHPCAPMTPLGLGAGRGPQSSFRMIGHCQGRNIVQLGKTESGRLLRSSFSQSRPQSLCWRGEPFTDTGVVWPSNEDSAPGALPWSREGLAWTPLASFPKRRETAGPGLS
jgi:hypothetical protein